jgi:hypothetical protein
MPAQTRPSMRFRPGVGEWLVNALCRGCGQAAQLTRFGTLCCDSARCHSLRVAALGVNAGQLGWLQGGCAAARARRRSGRAAAARPGGPGGLGPAIRLHVPPGRFVNAAPWGVDRHHAALVCNQAVSAPEHRWLGRSTQERLAFRCQLGMAAVRQVAQQPAAEPCARQLAPNSGTLPPAGGPGRQVP